MTQQKSAVSAKKWQVSELSRFSKNTLCQQKLTESAKRPGEDSAYMMCQQHCVVISIDDELWPDADRLFIVCELWAASGFCQRQRRALCRCAYIIDLTQYWILEYTFSRWSSQENMLCQQNLTSPQNAWWWLSKNLLYQQKIDIFGLNMATEGIGVCK